MQGKVLENETVDNMPTLEDNRQTPAIARM